MFLYHPTFILVDALVRHLIFLSRQNDGGPKYLTEWKLKDVPIEKEFIEGQIF